MENFGELLFGIAIQLALIWVGVQIARAKGRPAVHGALAAFLCGPIGLVILALMPLHKDKGSQTLAELLTGERCDENLLELDGTKATDSDLKHVASYPDIEELRLGGTKITDAGLQHLMGLKKLQALDLSLTCITDDGVRTLLHLPSLTRLWLGGTQITDVGLAQLARISTLEEVHVVNTSITSAGVKQVRATLPRCKVYT